MPYIKIPKYISQNTAFSHNVQAYANDMTVNILQQIKEGFALMKYAHAAGNKILCKSTICSINRKYFWLFYSGSTSTTISLVKACEDI